MPAAKPSPGSAPVTSSHRRRRMALARRRTHRVMTHLSLTEGDTGRSDHVTAESGQMLA